MPYKWIAVAVLVLIILFAVFGGPVFAQDIVVPVEPTEVVLNWGDFLAILLANLAQPDSVAWTLLGLALTWLVTRLPAPFQWAFKLFQVEQLLQNSIKAAMNATTGAVQGQAVNIDVGSEVFAKALQYAIDNGSKAVIDWAGGPQGLGDKLVARIPTAEGVNGAQLVSKARVATPAPVGRSLVD